MNGCAPMFCRPEVHTSGTIVAARVAVARPLVNSSWVSVPASKNFSINDSSASATISISASRADCAASLRPAGISPSVILPDASPANEYAFIDTRSTTPVKFFSSPSGSWIGTIVRPSVCRSDSSTRSSEARSRSSRFTATMRGSASSSATAQAFSVCTSTPDTPSTTSTAPSATCIAARASEKKLPNPGVSIRLILVLFHSA